MIRSHTLLQINVAEQAALVRVFAAHRRPHPRLPGNQQRANAATFSAACSHVRFQEVGRGFPFRDGCAGQETGPEDAG
jgi:hypothetical protein